MVAKWGFQMVICGGERNAHLPIFVIAWFIIGIWKAKDVVPYHTVALSYRTIHHDQH